MNNDYLWNKTGSDAEIERLEQKLSVFKSKKVSPLPLLQVSEKAQRPWLRPFAFGAVGLASACLLLVGLWVGFRPSKSDSVPIAVMQEPIELPVLSANPKDTNQETEKVQKKPEIPQYVPLIYRDFSSKPRSPGFTSGTARQIRQSNISKYPNRTVKTSFAELTEDERNAYKQLMLALSITGSKLRMVKDKIDGANKKQGDAKNPKIL